MELKTTSDLIKVELDTGEGATSPILFYHKGYISDYAKKIRMFAAQVTKDNQLTIHRYTDFKGEEITSSSKKANFPIATNIVKTGTMYYVNRMSVSRHSNVIQQTAPTRQWVFYQFDWVEEEFVKCLILDLDADNSSSIIYLTRNANHLYLKVSDGLGDWYIYYIDLSTHGKYGTVLTATDSWQVTISETDICAGEKYLYVMESGTLTVYEHGDYVTPFATYSSIITDTVVEMREIDDDDLFVRASGSTLYQIEAGEVLTLSTALETDTSDFRVYTRGSLYVESINVSQTPNDADEHNNNWYITTETGEINADLGWTVDEICTEVGISLSDIDTTQLNETTVQGFIVNNYSIADAYLKQLMIAYQFDRVESGGGLKFVERGGASSQTIDTNRLAANIGGAGANTNYPERISRTLEASRLIPKEVKVIYTEQQKDYDQTEQSILRQDAPNRDQQVLDMIAFAWTDAVAKQLADKIISLYFSEREQFVFILSSYYYNIEPGDIVTVEIDSENVEVRVTQVTFNFPGIIQVQGVFNNINDYDSSLDGSTGDAPQQTFEEFDDYETFILDVPYLFDGDANDTVAGVYIFARSLGSDYDNPQTLKTNTGQNSWSTVGAVPNESVVGTCTTTLGDATPDLVDYVNSVTIQLKPTDSLSSVSDLDFYNGVNMCAIGSKAEGYEILYFKTAIEIGSGDGVFQISNLIRGVKGTEHLIDKWNFTYK